MKPGKKELLTESLYVAETTPMRSSIFKSHVTPKSNCINLRTVNEVNTDMDYHEKVYH